MSETTPKSFWRKPLSGWRGFLLSFALLAGAAFVVIVCLSLIDHTNRSIVDLTFYSALFALGFSLVVMLAVAFLRWLCHWRNFKRFLFGATCLVTLIVLFFTEETWRGRRAWEKYRDAAEAKGEKFSLASLVPPPVPEEKNFAVTPLLQTALDYTYTTNGVQWRDTNGLAHLSQLQADLSSQPEKLVVGSLAKGTLTDLEVCRDFYRGNTNYPQPAKSGSAAADILVALGKFDVELNELREASDTRPESRFPIKYEYEPTWAILLPHLAYVKGIDKVVQLRAIARLELGQPDEAFKDLKLGFRLSDSIRNEPFLIDQLVRIAVLDLDLQTVREGLVRRAWSDAQLVELEKYLASLDLLAEFKLGMRGERALGVEGLDYYRRRGVHASPMDLANMESNGHTPFLAGCLNRMAGGFYYQNMLTIAKTHEKFTLPSVDEKAHRIYPEFADGLDQEVDKLHRRIYLHPYKVFSTMLMPALSRAVAKSGRMQAYVDEARVACALERFRLANGQLPEKLEALVPRFIDAIPNDVVDGQPLRYHPSAAGGYILYSIGWNRVDDGGKVDGGKVVFDRTTPVSADSKPGDWVWQMPGK